ncbi:Hexaprenyl-diphosphate synthase large subunit ((2E,6E)-farnesyl-diphosphate specific) [Pseudoclavibacter triregionum]|nr:Hexaprenyl-diphosphate synthase large subunit ((2E,6E)-farnesyl-diphosphate specific) [Pseudoclavibacter triregionum]
MADSSRLQADVQAVIDGLLAEQRREFAPLGPDAALLIDHAEPFLRGGKRLRAEFLAAGYRSIAGEAPLGERSPVVQAAAALELFHAAALAHDDIIDRSDTRRGAPSTHRVFESRHGDAGWTGDGARFGESAAIIFGDLVLVWSDERFIEACSLVEPDRGRRAREEFRRMRAEVAAGQYLDLVEELAWPVVPVEERAERARRVATSKSARYSVEAPLVLGALLAGADDAAVERIRAFGLPLGLAFQFRDDILGVTGDERVTGKPAGDDLREGKRTVLIAAAESRASAEERAWLDARLGNPDLSPADVREMIDRIVALGAVDDVEAEIARLLEEALSSLESASLDPESRELLEALAHRAARREV